MESIKLSISRISRHYYCFYLVATSLIIVISAYALGQSCPHPDYPTPTAAPIDSTSCGPAGNGGADTAQNEAKNNFCASGAKPVTVADMVSLQEKVEADTSIPFGNPDIHPLTKTPGPATDRKPLQALGEGHEVVLTGFLYTAPQEGAESVNCKGNPGVPNEDAYHDIHISILANPTDAECKGVVVEMIPHHRPKVWTPALVKEAAKLPVRVTDQLMFDSSHTPCVNGPPVKKGNESDPARAFPLGRSIRFTNLRFARRALAVRGVGCLLRTGRSRKEGSRNRLKV
jgi:hypothetical protein